MNILLAAILAFTPLKPAVAQNIAFKAQTDKSYTGIASYYSNGHRTASGQRYNKHELTAAHKHIKFGTRLTVKNLNNNRVVEVVVNDRIPRSNKRLVDLSQAAAKKIDCIGICSVEIYH
jgi:rare lipoprotein A